MRSLICKSFPGVRDEGEISLFKSCRSRYPDGEQKRDFIYVKDAVAMTIFFMEKPDIGGIFNVGTGHARSWNDVAAALFSSLDKTKNIRDMNMPETLRDRYQYFTEADLSNLRKAGCTRECGTLESTIEDYVKNYLINGTFLD
jgi:ADP-L-glycero-D-manno-heptose 6-epimerase